MPTSYAKNKIHIQKWREKNPEKNREINRKNQLKYDRWKKVKMDFLRILL
jgi:hypothetical protein